MSRLTECSNCGEEREVRARGLCSRCYMRSHYRGELGDLRPLQHWADYADDYRMLARQGYPLDVIASRLGLTLKALDKALERHKDDPRAERPRRFA